MFHFSLKRLFGIFFVPINILPVTLEVCADVHGSSHVKGLSMLTDYNQHWLCQQRLIKLLDLIKIRLELLELLHVDHTDIIKI